MCDKGGVFGNMCGVNGKNQFEEGGVNVYCNIQCN